MSDLKAYLDRKGLIGKRAKIFLVIVLNLAPWVVPHQEGLSYFIDRKPKEPM